MCACFLFSGLRGRKSGGRRSFSPKKSKKLPPQDCKREKKKEKKHKTRKKKIHQPQTKFLVVWQFFTHSLTRSNTKSSARLNLNRERTSIHFDCLINSFREKKRATRDLLKKAVWFFRFLFFFRVLIIRLKRRRATKEIYNTHTHKRVLYHHLQREKSARKEVH